MKNNSKIKVTPAFVYALGIISMLGFIAIIGNTWFNFAWLSENTESLILIVLGVGLILEGNMLLFRQMIKNGLTSSEITHIVTGIVGILSLVIGLVSLFGYSSDVVIASKGIIASIAVFIILIQIIIVK